MTPPSSRWVCTSPRAVRCVHCHSAQSCGINTPLEHNQCHYLDSAQAQDWGHVSSDTAHLFLWIHTVPLQSSSWAMQRNTKDTAATCRHKKHSHLLPLPFGLGQVPWGVELQEELPQNCASHCQQIQGKGEISSGWKVTLLKTKGMAHLSVEKCQDTPKVTEPRTSQEQLI